MSGLPGLIFQIQQIPCFQEIPICSCLRNMGASLLTHSESHFKKLLLLRAKCSIPWKSTGMKNSKVKAVAPWGGEEMRIGVSQTDPRRLSF